jgi:hypothetical protein
MRNWIKAIDSGWRAFWKQYKTTRSKQRRAAMPDPFGGQS